MLGRSERLDLLHAALINGMSSQVLVLDGVQSTAPSDGSASVAAAILALAEHRSVPGAHFLHAFVLGMEAEFRVGYAVHPSHHDVGWHPRGTAGVFGAAAACGRLLALGDELSNDSEELRKEREEIRKNREVTRKSRVKNDRLFKKHDNGGA